MIYCISLKVCVIRPFLNIFTQEMMMVCSVVIKGLNLGEGILDHKNGSSAEAWRPYLAVIQ